VPAAAVIPAPIAYIKVVAVKKLVVGFRSGPGTRSCLLTGARTGSLRSALEFCSWAIDRTLASGSLLSPRYSPSRMAHVSPSGADAQPPWARGFVLPSSPPVTSSPPRGRGAPRDRGTEGPERSSGPFTLNKLECSKQAFFERP